MPRSSDDRIVPIAVGALLVGLLAFAALLALTSCTKQEPTKVPTYEQARSQALKEGPLVQAPVEDRRKLKCDQKGVAVKKGPGVPFTGVLIPPAKAACLKAQVAERDRLRREAAARELQLRTGRIIREAGIKALAEKTQRTWWERNQGTVLYSLGVATGVAILLGLVYGLTGGKGVSTQAHILPKAR